MAVIDKMPPRYLYGRYRGLFDWYTYKGLVCVRQWPMRMSRTPAAIATWDNMIRSCKRYKDSTPDFKYAYNRLGSLSKLAPRDIYEHYDMRRQANAIYTEVQSVEKKVPGIEIKVDSISGAKPFLRYSFLPENQISRFVSWEGIGEVICRAHATDWFRPVFYGCLDMQFNWSANNGKVTIPHGDGFLFFVLDDPGFHYGYCSGVYVFDVSNGSLVPF